MKDSVIIEVQGYFWGELSRLERELAAEEEEYRKAVKVLRNLPFASRLERPLGPFLKWLLSRKAEKLKTEIADLREKIKQYRQAETELEEGKYGLALIFLNELADRGAARGTSIVFGFNSMFSCIIDLKKELEARMRGEATEPVPK